MASTTLASHDSTFTSTEDISLAMAKQMFEEQLEDEYKLYCIFQRRFGRSIISLEAYAKSRYELDANNGFQGVVSDENMAQVRQEYMPDGVVPGDDEQESRGNGTNERRASRDEEVQRQDNYESLLLLGEQLGDVRTERWGMIASHAIEQLPTFVYTEDQKLSAIYRAHGARYHADCGDDNNDTEHICLICQAEYEVGDKLRRLPCNHCFHADCVDRWLKQKDQCPTCRNSIQSGKK